MKKRVPSFWWDFVHEGNEITSIIVQSDEPTYPVLAIYYREGTDMEPQIEMAEKIIADLKAGRITMKSCKKMMLSGACKE